MRTWVLELECAEMDKQRRKKAWVRESWIRGCTDSRTTAIGRIIIGRTIIIDQTPRL